MAETSLGCAARGKVIRFPYTLSAEAAWTDYVIWYGIHVGEFSEETLIADAAELALEIRVLALGELHRRSGLEEKGYASTETRKPYWQAILQLREKRRREHADRCPGWLDTSGWVQA